MPNGPYLGRVLAWPYDDLTGNGTEVTITGGRISRDINTLSVRFEFGTKHSYNEQHEDYDPVNLMLQRGAIVRVDCTENGSFSLGQYMTRFYGAVMTWHEQLNAVQGSQDDSPLEVRYEAFDRFKVASHAGVNLAKAARQLQIEVTAQFAYDFEDEHTLNIPVDSVTQDYDYVPDGIDYLVAYYEVGGETKIRDYGPDEYIYLANAHQIIFVWNQDHQINDDPNWHLSATWVIRRRYYDPTDTASSVKQAWIEILTGDPFSYQGGLGIDPYELDLDEITSFDLVSAKLIRRFLVDKPDSTIAQIRDEMRDTGLLPRNYIFFDNPETGLIEGRYVVQNNSAPVQLQWVAANCPTTLEGIAAIVENYGQAISPQNYALGATAILTEDSAFLTAYEKVGHEDNTIDNDGTTSLQFHRAGALLDDDPMGSPIDLVQYDLCPDVGDPDYRDIRRITFRGAIPREPDEDAFIPSYYERQAPRVTIVGSLDPITALNPGVPVAKGASNIAIGIGPYTSEIAQDFDIDVVCDGIRQVRYVGIRFEQEGHFRRTQKKVFGDVKRIGYIGIGEIGIYGHDVMTYPDGHPDQGRVPFAQLTPFRTEVTLVGDTENFRVDNTGGIGEWISVGDLIQVNSGATPQTVEVLVATNGGAFIALQVTPGVTGVMVGDEVGWRKRWMRGLSGTYWDFYRPKLWQKHQNIGIQQDHLTSGEAGSIEEAEAMCADRLFELLSIASDHFVEHLYDHDVDVGVTVLGDAAQGPFLVLSSDIILSSASNETGLPGVTMISQGTNFDQEPE